MLPMIFDESAKKTMANPFFNETGDPAYYASLENVTSHYIGTFNYFVGMRFSYKRIKWVENTDELTQTVLP